MHQQIPTGEARDAGDWQRLRHARERHTGFAVGRYLQPAPMLFTREAHNVFLGDMYRGQAAFLICSGPSLSSHDLSLLDQRGIVTLAVNNAAVVHRPRLWCSVDDPGNFCDAIWYDPGILKFVPLCHMEKRFMVRDEQDQLVPSPHCVGDMPAVFGYRRNEAFNADQWLYEDTFNWGNHSDRVDDYGNKGSRSVMYVALRLLFYLGIRRVYLLGCDFRMEAGQANYAFEQDRTPGSIRGNNSSYRILNSRLEHLLPAFAREGFEVFNCTPESGLTIFPHLPYETAVAEATSLIPSRIITAGMYDRQQRERDARKQQEQVPAPQSAPPATTDPAILSSLTLITAIDEQYARRLKLAWPTWMKFKPELREVPVLIIHDERFDPHSPEWAGVFDHPRLRFIPWSMPEAETQRERMLTALVQVAAREVQTDWYLKLDAETLATGPVPWLDSAWFAPDGQGRLPAIIASPWGYTKPADALARLDDWGDGIPGLSCRPRLEVPFDPAHACVRHPRIASWCFFGNTAWTREVAAYAPRRLPVPSQDTYLFYCAARRGDLVRRVKMTRFGWEHISCSGKLTRRCQELLATEAPQETTDNSTHRLASRKQFADLIRERNYTSAVEVGVFRGEFAAHLLQSCPGLHLTLVDPWDGSGMSKPYDGEAVHAQVQQLESRFGSDRVTLVRQRSPEAVSSPLITGRQFDFIYIDADHSHEAVVKDIRAWRPLVRVGGILAGHDYNNRGHKRVKQAVDSIFPHVNQTGETCASWWVEKASPDLPH